jgi:DNA-binding NarL/FixJ family response regulator
MDEGPAHASNYRASILERYLGPEQFGSVSRINSELLEVEVGAKIEIVIGVIESKTFLRECIRRSMQSAFRAVIVTFSSVSEFETEHGEHGHAMPSAILLSLVEGTVEGAKHSLNVLSELVPRVPVILFSYRNDPELVRIAITHGAKGYIPATMDFDIALEAVRFVLAGGTYVPMDCFLATNWPGATPSQPPASLGMITSRELAVVRAIQQGKPNKLIAYDLNMCESTVKVHVRSIMKKIKAKNRTEVAIKTSQLLPCPRCASQAQCWSTGRCLKRIESSGR